jgi:hypothetical protein
VDSAAVTLSGSVGRPAFSKMSVRYIIAVGPMSIGNPMSLPSWVLPCFHFHGRNPDASLSAPNVFRSTNLLAWGRKEAMSSPLIPVMSGTKLPAASVVTNFCLKSPPMTEGFTVALPAKWVTASATTLSDRPPPQYQRASDALEPLDLVDLPEVEQPAAAATAAPATPPTPIWRSRLREIAMILLPFEGGRGGGDVRRVVRWR